MSNEPLIVEVCMEKNRQLIFTPLNEKLRGRWNNTVAAGRSMHESLQTLSELPYIPGIRLLVDTAKRRLGKIDPLGTDEFAATFRIINKVAGDHPQLFGGSQVRVEDPVLYEADQVSDDELKRWLYWIWRGIKGGKLMVVSGTAPSIDEIRALPGYVRQLKPAPQSNGKQKQTSGSAS